MMTIEEWRKPAPCEVCGKLDSPKIHHFFVNACRDCAGFMYDTEVCLGCKNLYTKCCCRKDTKYVLCPVCKSYAHLMDDDILNCRTCMKIFLLKEHVTKQQWHWEAV